MDLRGVWATVLLPLAADDDIDFGRLEAEVDTLLTTGVHGIHTNGSAGEFHTLSDAEYDRLHDLVATRCRAAGMPFQLGASHPGGHRSLELIRRAAALAPDAIQVVLPDWLPLAPDEVLAAVDRMARVVDGVLVVLYNPPCAKTQVDAELFARLADEVPVRWYEQMRTDPPAALDLERRLQLFFADHIAPLSRQGYRDPALDKTLAAIGGWAPVGTRVRWPHRFVPADVVPALRDAARQAVPELLDA